jgi:hypothetical protein
MMIDIMIPVVFHDIVDDDSSFIVAMIIMMIMMLYDECIDVRS